MGRQVSYVVVYIVYPLEIIVILLLRPHISVSLEYQKYPNVEKKNPLRPANVHIHTTNKHW